MLMTVSMVIIAIVVMAIKEIVVVIVLVVMIYIYIYIYQGHSSKNLLQASAAGDWAWKTALLQTNMEPHIGVPNSGFRVQSLVPLNVIRCRNICNQKGPTLLRITRIAPC